MIRIYTDDHPPAHGHGIRAEHEVTINLGDTTTRPALRDNKGMRQHAVREALRIVAEQQAELLAAWRQIHG
ncbi:MAG: DUF4160 domain-containing protein [Candidatus Tectimicrobiota bacterium]